MTTRTLNRRTEPWRFHLLDDEQVAKVCALQKQKILESGKAEEAAEKKRLRWKGMPGWLVATQVLPALRLEEATGGSSGGGRSGGREVSLSSGFLFEAPDGVPKEDYAACCCAVQNLCLSLHSEGIGTKWTSGPVNFDGRFAGAAGLGPDEVVVATVWFGTSKEGHRAVPPKKALGVHDVLIRAGKPRRTVAAAHAATRDDDASSGSC